MRTEQIKREMKKLRRKVERAPRIWRFRGRPVVHDEEWKYGDWSKLPDGFSIVSMSPEKAPEDWYRDYLALMEKLEDPFYGRMRCSYCAIDQAQRVKREIDRHEKHWDEHGGEAAKEKFYTEAGELHARYFRKSDAMRKVKWRVFNELAGAENRTCDVNNFFHCPYKYERDQLQKDGYDAHHLWCHVHWYDEHWNRSTTHTPAAPEMKWYHYDEPSIIDVTNYDDIMRAIDDGRLDKIIDEHTRYMKETRREIWAL